MLVQELFFLRYTMPRNYMNLDRMGKRLAANVEYPFCLIQKITDAWRWSWYDHHVTRPPASDCCANGPWVFWRSRDFLLHFRQLLCSSRYPAVHWTNHYLTSEPTWHFDQIQFVFRATPFSRLHPLRLAIWIESHLIYKDRMLETGPLLIRVSQITY